MQFFTRVLVCALACIAASLEETGHESYLTELTSLNFDGVVDGSSHVLVAFVAPWCGHCRTLAPDLEKIAKHFEEETWFKKTKRVSDDIEGQPSIVVARCDATVELTLAATHEVSGYPSLRFFPFGSTLSEPYSGGRTAEAISQWLIDRTGLTTKVKPYLEALPQAVQLMTSTFDSVAYDTGRTVFVLFTAPWCVHCAEFAKTFEDLAMAFKDDADLVTIATVDADQNRGLSERFDVSGFPTLKLFSRNDGPSEVYHLDDTDVGGGPSTGAAYLYAEHVAEMQMAKWSGVHDGREDDEATMMAPVTGVGVKRYQQELPALVAFLNARAGTARRIDGRLLASAARSPAIELFLKARPALRDALRQDADGIESGLNNEGSAAYDNPSESEVEALANAVLSLPPYSFPGMLKESSIPSDSNSSNASSSAALQLISEWSSRRSEASGGWVLGTGLQVAESDTALRVLGDLRVLVEASLALARGMSAASPRGVSEEEAMGGRTRSSSGSGGGGGKADQTDPSLRFEDMVLYVKVLEKALTRRQGNSAEWLLAEEKRVTRMAESSSVAGPKKTLLGKRANVIRAILQLKDPPLV